MSERRSHVRKPIRLKVAYTTAKALVTEYTKSISKGGCSIEAKKPLPVGTEFAFEMFSPKTGTPVEVRGRVVYAMSVNNGQSYTLGIQYVEGEDKRAGLERVIDEIFSSHRYDPTRAHPRVPLNVVGFDASNPVRQYVIRDVSEGGLGLGVIGKSLPPPGIATGTPVRIELELEGPRKVALEGEVVWITGSPSNFGEAGIGVAFKRLTDQAKEELQSLVHLRTIPQRASFQFQPRPAAG